MPKGVVVGLDRVYERREVRPVDAGDALESGVPRHPHHTPRGAGQSQSFRKREGSRERMGEPGSPLMAGGDKHALKLDSFPEVVPRSLLLGRCPLRAGSALGVSTGQERVGCSQVRR